MPEELKEGALPTSEPQELAAPEVSEVAEVQQPSPAPTGQTEEQLKQLTNVVTALTEKVEKFAKESQSAKDRAISKTAKEVAEIKARLDALGGDWNALSQEAEAQSLYQRLDTLEARISQPPARQQDTWQSEWDAESRKLLDAAEKLGVTLTTEEYNAALFGKKFATKGDAYAALNQALLRKGRGEAVPVAAIATEGGEVARVPEPAAPKPFRQKVNDALSAGKSVEARKLIDEQWDNLDKQSKLEAARRAAAAAGVELKV